MGASISFDGPRIYIELVGLAIIAYLLIRALR